MEITNHYAHFDAGGIRLSIHRHDGPVRARGSFFVFIVKRNVDGVVRELKKRGVKFAKPVKNYEFGRAAYFYDPDGHELWVWQLPRRGDTWYEDEKVLVSHYEKISRKLGLKEKRRRKRRFGAY